MLKQGRETILFQFLSREDKALSFLFNFFFVLKCPEGPVLNTIEIDENTSNELRWDGNKF